ncbi:MAG: ATP-binding cassette, subfamily B, bacterial [Bacteroidetes bacterium HLUCCA01]|nr:MAG: ATP-binding cassette, subfamily B, bacterial [Bacteroidetes bacterium HLUCCA01]
MMVGGVLFLTLSNAFLVWIPVLVRQTMDSVESLADETVFGDTSVVDILISDQAGWVIAKGVLLLLAASFLYGFLLFLTRQTLIVASRYIELDLRTHIYDKLQRLPQEYYAKNRTGDIYIRATEDVSRVREYFGPGFMYGVNTITRAGIIITIMFLVNAELTLWALMPLPLLSVIAYWMSSFIHKRSNEIQEQYAVLAGKAQETFSSIRLIKSFAREAYEQERFDRESEIYRRKKLRLDIVESLFHPTLNLLVGASIVLVIWKGGLLVMEGVVTVGNIAEFIIYVLFLTWPIAALGYTLNLVQRSAASNIRIQKLLDEPEMRDDMNGTTMDLSRLKIEFRNVSFTYPGATEKALNNINLTIDDAMSVAIVGRTGAGKSTLVQLLTRMYDVNEGQICINGTDIRDIPIDRLRSVIGYVPQETFLFSETIANNIAFGKENASFTEVENAARAAAVYDNVMLFENKFETVLGERGITLSGGQKQRTSIARSLIRSPKLLILDDSLSAVDTNTESQIVTYIRKALETTNVIQISHRIQSIRDADIIYLIHEGSVAEQGTHDELIERNGHYATMYRKQQLEKELAEIN